MLRKRAFGIAIAMVFASSLMAQNNVQITLSLASLVKRLPEISSQQGTFWRLTA